ncbi:MAG: ABC transporter substrate-binding protein [Betaproteobacteria bacterium]|nr:ABC transporter substrate-binding protein [Betaproteobacteria bacterium]
MKLAAGALLIAFAQAAFAQEVAAPQPFVIAGAIAQSGLLEKSAAGYRRGLLLWQDEINAAGGAKGRHVELRLEDDHSDATETRRIYERLAAQPGVDLLVGPFGSAAQIGAAAMAGRARRVLINATAAASAVQRHGGAYVVQVAAPFSSYGTAALDLLREEGLRRVLILARGDLASQEAAAGLRRQAIAQGLDVPQIEAFSAGARDFASQVALAKSLDTEAWVAFGKAYDAAEMVKTFKRLDYAPYLFIAQGAADPAFVQRVGQDAEWAIGISPYEPRAATHGNPDFVRAYASRWDDVPDLGAAQGYAAGKLIEQAVRDARSLDSEVLRASFVRLRSETPLGSHIPDAAGGAHAAAQPLLVQIVKGRSEIIWPARYATAQRTLPYPQWKTRQPIGE